MWCTALLWSLNHTLWQKLFGQNVRMHVYIVSHHGWLPGVWTNEAAFMWWDKVEWCHTWALVHGTHEVSIGGRSLRVWVWGWPPDDWRAKRFMDEWWRACGTADRKRGRFCFGQLMSDCFPCLWMELLASMVRNFAGWLIQCSHTLGWGRWTDLSSLCISAQSIHEQRKRGSLGEIKRFKMFRKEIFREVYCYILFQSSDTQTELSEVLVTENVVHRADKSREHIWRMTDRIETRKKIFARKISTYVHQKCFKLVPKTTKLACLTYQNSTILLNVW